MLRVPRHSKRETRLGHVGRNVDRPIMGTSDLRDNIKAQSRSLLTGPHIGPKKWLEQPLLCFSRNRLAGIRDGQLELLVVRECLDPDQLIRSAVRQGAPQQIREQLTDAARLESAAEQGRGALAGADRRSRLPEALDGLLRAPVLTLRRWRPSSESHAPPLAARRRDGQALAGLAPARSRHSSST